MAHSVALPGRSLAIVCIYNNLDPDQSGYILRLNQVIISMKSILTCVLFP